MTRDEAQQLKADIQAEEEFRVYVTHNGWDDWYVMIYPPSGIEHLARIYDRKNWRGQVVAEMLK